jgi:hypothetical protein
MKRIFKNHEVATALSLYAFGFDQTKKADKVELHVKGRVEGEIKEMEEIEMSIELIDVNEKVELTTLLK